MKIIEAILIFLKRHAIAVVANDGKRVPLRDLIHRTVYNSFLVPLPSTDETGQSSQQQSLAADEQEHEDELINRNDLYDPPQFLLVDRYDRTIIIPYASE
jgi:hypothetical protein